MATTRNAERPRSSPICIVRPGEERQDVGDSSDDDDDILEGGLMAGLSLGYVGSVPVRETGIRRRKPGSSSMSQSLPGAPLLASKGSHVRKSDEPPPMSLTENTDSNLHLTYGSLRESHLEGKFLDGPASFRDRSGQIHELRHHQQIRLDDSATSYQRPFLLPPMNNKGGTNELSFSLGERIMAGTSATNKSPTTSSLSNMMQGLPTPPSQVPSNMAAASAVQPHIGLYDSQDEHDTAVLSTSLTAFEVLQSARRRPDLLQNQHQEYDPPTSSNLPSFPESPLPAGISSFLSQDEDDDAEDVFELDME